MNRKIGMCGAAVVACVGASASGDVTVELRLWPRLGFSHTVPGYEAVYDLAVQARVNSTGSVYGLSAFGFNIRIAGEAESAGTLWPGGISLTDGTYDPELGAANRVGRGGLARQFAYLANLNQNFNGKINASSGSFTNGPDQEIGLIVGSTGAAQLMSTPGMDDDLDALPDSDPLSPALMGTYFGAGEYVDIYRFRYGQRQITDRTLSFLIEGVSGVQAFANVEEANGVWGPSAPVTISGANLTTTGVEIRVLPSAGGLVGIAGWGLLGVRRRR